MLRVDLPVVDELGGAGHVDVIVLRPIDVQRAQLDAQRNRTSGQSPQPVRELRLDGIVRRSDGHQTVWINGEAHSGSLPHIKVGSRSISLLAAPGKTVEIPVGGPSAFTNGAEP